MVYIIKISLYDLEFKILKIQAPGNHEFDDGIEGLEPFLRNVTFPIVCANCDLSDLPELKDFIDPSITVELNGRKIGIIGFVLPEVIVSRKI